MALPTIARISAGGLARSSASLCSRAMGTAAASPATSASAQEQPKPKKKVMASFDWTDALNLASAYLIFCLNTCTKLQKFAARETSPISPQITYIFS